MPGLHALIVGVSRYPHLPGGGGEPAASAYGMRQLTAAASTAARLADWLAAAGDALAAPLVSSRLLLSPSPDELARRPDLADALPAERETFEREALAWREECAADRDGVALFYFAGHGLQRSRSDAVLLLADFGSTGGSPLRHSPSVSNLFAGMAPTARRPDMARTQLWFVDACRGFPSEFDSFETLPASEILEVELSDRDDRCAPLYFGALPGTSAFSVAGESTLFGRALLECLGGAAAEQRPGQPWRVTVGSLLRGLQALVEEMSAEEGVDQEVWDGGQSGRPDTPIVTLRDVPAVRVRLELRPPHGARAVRLAVRRLPDGAAVEVPAPLDPNPYSARWPAGIYDLRAEPAADGIPAGLHPVLPPVFPWVGELAP